MNKKFHYTYEDISKITGISIKEISIGRFNPLDLESVVDFVTLNRRNKMKEEYILIKLLSRIISPILFLDMRKNPVWKIMHGLIKDSGYFMINPVEWRRSYKKRRFLLSIDNRYRVTTESLETLSNKMEMALSRGAIFTCPICRTSLKNKS